MRIEQSAWLQSPEFRKVTKDKAQETAQKAVKKDQYFAGADSKQIDQATITQLKSYIMNLPDVRQEKIEEAKTKIANKSYDNFPDEIADKLIDIAG